MEIKVKDANYKGSYHYHGSFFEYDWELITEDGLKNVVCFKEYSKEDIMGSIVEIDGDIFTIR